MKNAAFVATLIASAIMPTGASAATLYYNFTPVDSSRSTFSFEIDDNPTDLILTNISFQTPVRNYRENNVTSSFPRTFYFYTPQGGGGFIGGTYNAYGPQLFSGSLSAPTLLTGNFKLFANWDLTTNLGNLTVTNAVPEPATWAMMLIGFGMIAGTARYRRRSSKVTFA